MKRFSLSRGSTALAFAAFFMCTSVHAGVELPPWRWGKGAFGLSASSEYFQTNANYDENRGSFNRLANGNKLTSFENSVRARYAFTRYLSAYVGMGFSQVRVVETSVEKTNSMPTEAFVGADFMLPIKWLRVIPEIQAGYPIDKIDINTTQALTNDGVTYARASVFLHKPTKFIEFFGHGGVKVPTEGLAKLFIYGAGVEVPLGRTFALGGGVSGYEPVMKDELTAGERNRVTTARNGGSFRFYAYNPSLLEGAAWVRFKPTRDIAIRAGYNKTLNGIRSAEGQSVLLSVSFNLPGSNRSDSESGKSKQVKDNLKYFENGVEQADPESFEANDEVDAPTTGDVLDDTEKMLDKKR